MRGRGYGRVLSGDYRQAVADAEEALRCGPPSPRLYYNVARIYAQASGNADSSTWERSRHEARTVELLCAALVNHGRHRHEGAVFRLRQSAQIAPRHRRAVARLGSEEPTIAANEGRESVRDAFDQRSGQPSSGHTVT